MRATPRKSVGGRVRHQVRAVGLAVLLVVAAVACDVGSGAAEPTATTKTGVAKKDFGAVVGNISFDYAGQKPFPDGPVDLIGPHYALRIDRIALTDHLTQMQADRFDDTGSWELPDYDILKPASGQRFLLIHAVQTTSVPALSNYKEDNAPPGKVKGAVRVGGTTVPLPGDLRHLALLTGQATMLVSIPAAGSPVLQVADAGRTQSLDLTTGHRGKDAFPAFYPVRSGKDCSVGAYHQTMQVETKVETSCDSLSLQPYVEDGGWAPQGKAWLNLTGQTFGAMRDLGGHPVPFVAVLDVPKSFSLDLGKGTRVAAKGVAASSEPTSSTDVGDASVLVGAGSFDIRFLVPDTFRTGTLHFTPRGTFTLDGKHVAWSPSETPGAPTLSVK